MAAITRKDGTARGTVSERTLARRAQTAREAEAGWSAVLHDRAQAQARPMPEAPEPTVWTNGPRIPAQAPEAGWSGACTPTFSVRVLPDAPAEGATDTGTRGGWGAYLAPDRGDRSGATEPTRGVGRREAGRRLRAAMDRCAEAERDAVAVCRAAFVGQASESDRRKALRKADRARKALDTANARDVQDAQAPGRMPVLPEGEPGRWSASDAWRLVRHGLAYGQTAEPGAWSPAPFAYTVASITTDAVARRYAMVATDRAQYQTERTPASPHGITRVAGCDVSAVSDWYTDNAERSLAWYVGRSVRRILNRPDARTVDIDDVAPSIPAGIAVPSVWYSGIAASAPVCEADIACRLHRTDGTGQGARAGCARCRRLFLRVVARANGVSVRLLTAAFVVNAPGGTLAAGADAVGWSSPEALRKALSRAGLPSGTNGRPRKATTD